ncbi:reverse transcriptase-rnase h-integrase [Moniliophthora roreri]|nr:reverse transcriptase-rnase h-integrase [Moniliophthora roreri]
MENRHLVSERLYTHAAKQRKSRHNHRCHTLIPLPTSPNCLSKDRCIIKPST